MMTAQTVAVDDLKDYFECPICFCVPKKPPIYQCGKGHLICADCRPRVFNCPVCRTPMANECRLYFAERLLEERVPVPCCYEEDGCQEQRLMVHMKIHEKKCPFAPVPCSYGRFGCQVKPRAKQLNDHLLKCEYRLTKCPLLNCRDDVLYKQMEAHLKDKHSIRQFNLKIVYALVFISVLSIFVNMFLLWNFQ